MRPNDFPNRFTGVHTEWLVPTEPSKLTVSFEKANRILSKNKSPDLPFNWSLNPYRGCLHGCTYCYARPTHEYLGLNIDEDFESKIIVKQNAAILLKKEFEKYTWLPSTICFSGITDCYQSVEAKYKITRQCLAVCADYNNPVHIITRSPLVVRDLDLIRRLHKKHAVRVSISIPILNAEICRQIEPKAPPPAARLKAISILSQENIPVGVSLSPLIPGLNDTEIVSVLKAAKKAGARHAWMLLLRLPGALYPFFKSKMDALLPNQSTKIFNRLKRFRNGQLQQSQYGKRFKGQGPEWNVTSELFELWKKKLGYEPVLKLDTSSFAKPHDQRQMRLF